VAVARVGEFDGNRCFAGRGRGGGGLDHLDDRQLVLHGELVVAFVVGGHGHDRASAVTHQHVVGDPHRHSGAVGRVDCVGAGKHPAFVLGQVGALEVALAGGLLLVGVNRVALDGSGQGVDQRMFGGDHHVGDAKNRVGAGGEHLEVAELGRLELEQQFGSFAATDPGLLHALGRVGPVHVFEVGEQALGVGGDPQYPLAQVAALHGEAADLGLAVDDFLVGQYGAQLRTPPHRALVDVGQALFEQLEEDPLRPAVILGVSRIDLALPVVGKAEGFDLTTKVGDVVLGVGGGMGAGFHRVLLGGQAEGVPANRVEHVKTLGAFVARDDVGAGVALGVADVQTRAARVGKHVEHVVFRLRRVVGRAE
jgi:hypothetical protein